MNHQAERVNTSLSAAPAGQKKRNRGPASAAHATKHRAQITAARKAEFHLWLEMRKVPRKTWLLRKSPHQGSGQCITERCEGGGGREATAGGLQAWLHHRPCPCPVISAISWPLKVLPSPAECEKRRMVLTVPRRQKNRSISQEQAANKNLQNIPSL